MKHEHTIILVLLVTALILSIIMVTKKTKAEGFATKDAICKQQAQMVADAPHIGGTYEQAYANCMNTDYAVMPSAYVSM